MGPPSFAPTMRAPASNETIRGNDRRRSWDACWTPSASRRRTRDPQPPAASVPSSTRASELWFPRAATGAAPSCASAAPLSAVGQSCELPPPCQPFEPRLRGAPSASARRRPCERASLSLLDLASRWDTKSASRTARPR
eukprot:scaffold115_cov241-Pinguiococcus_pyrenoidosus.AAC.2